MIELVIRLKSGRELTVICEKCVYSKSKTFGNVTDITFEGVKNVRPIILNVDDIELMYEVLHND